ncbi:MAG: hypothetical protein J6X61_00075 [Clostridia bacterium]|nr:hypothetical protein [Clostridia bacterium]
MTEKAKMAEKAKENGVRADAGRPPSPLYPLRRRGASRADTGFSLFSCAASLSPSGQKKAPLSSSKLPCLAAANYEKQRNFARAYR